MAARRCVLHGSFPTLYEFFMCPVCGQPTDYLSNDEPDENWERNVIRHQENAETDAAPVEEIPTLEGARVFLDNDQYFISTWDVVGGGVNRQLRETDLVHVGKQTFEILSYSYEDRRYLVQPFSTTLSDEDMRKLQCPD